MQTDASVRPTVGRESELELLDAALDALAESGLVCVALEGEPGIGKTRLLGELRGRAEARRCLVLAGSATEFERDLPFSVWVDALDAHVASQELRLQVAWDAEAIAELGEVFPSLHRAAGPVSSVADERYRTHRAVRKLSSCSRPIDLWFCCSMICTGAMERRSSFWDRSFGVDQTPMSCWRWRFGRRRRRRVCLLR